MSGVQAGAVNGLLFQRPCVCRHTMVIISPSGTELAATLAFSM